MDSEGPDEEVLGGVFSRPAGSAAVSQPKPAAINFKLAATSPEVGANLPLHLTLASTSAMSLCASLEMQTLQMKDGTITIAPPINCISENM